MNFHWQCPVKIIFGPGRLESLKHELAGAGMRRPLVVAGASSMQRNGVLERVERMLSGMELSLHPGVRVNLPLSDCDAVIRAARDHDADCVVGVGGGSVLDGAKAAAWIAPHQGWIGDYAGADPRLPAPPPGLPLFVIPTTAGTGSEVTPFIILMDENKRVKLSLGSDRAFPRTAIVDPELCLTLPPDQTAATGLDALSHGFEAYWSKRANPVSDALALEAISCSLDHLAAAYGNPDDIKARSKMSYAATVAGMALSQTATAAVHGLTYPMTARHGVPHGIACAFLMREVLKINFHHLAADKQNRLKHAMKSNTIAAALDFLTDLYRELGVPETLVELSIPETEIKTFADQATRKNLEQNIASITRDKILEIWRQKLGN